MALDYGYFEPRELASIVRQIPPTTSFLRDRYFPNVTLFNTRKVTVEYKDGSTVLAPFVSPRKRGVVDYRNGYSVDEYEPANIAPMRVITTDDLDRKQFGEAVFSGMTPADRAVNIAREDLAELDQQITRREEWMAAQVMLTNGCVMHHIADKADEYQEMEIHFYDGTDNPAVYTPGASWGTTGADIMDDLHNMIRMLTKRGLPATDVIVGEEVADVMLKDSTIQSLLDNRRIQLGEINPEELPDGAAKLMTLNIKGHKVSVYTYDTVYTDDSGNTTPYIPSDSVIVTAPGAGRRAYGRVTMINGGGKKFETQAAMRVAKQIADERDDTYTTQLISKPILMPIQKNPWISASVLA